MGAGLGDGWQPLPPRSDEIDKITLTPEGPGLAEHACLGSDWSTASYMSIPSCPFPPIVSYSQCLWCHGEVARVCSFAM